MQSSIEASNANGPGARPGEQDAGPGRHQDAGATGKRKGRMGMGRIIKALALLVVVAFIGLVAYSYVADLSPRQGEVTVPVTLDAP